MTNRSQTELIDQSCMDACTHSTFSQEYFEGTGLTNITEDLNSTEKIDSFYFYETEQFTVLWLLFAVIVAGNAAVLAGLLLGKRRKSRMDFFIKQLAFADLLVGLISVLTDIVWRSTVTWHAGNVACKLIRFMQAVVTYSSTYVLVALSIDRYDAITRPMNFSGSWWRARALIAAAWGLSVLFSVPIIFLYEEKLIEGTIQCWIDLGSPIQWRIYMSLVSFSLLIAPSLIIGGCYAVIVTTIWSQSGILRQGPIRDTRRASSRGLIPRAKIKTVKMTLVIVLGIMSLWCKEVYIIVVKLEFDLVKIIESIGIIVVVVLVFVLCWSPYIVFDLLQVFGHVPRTQTNIAVATFIQSLAPLNSAANPIIYCLFSTPFCKTVRNLQAISWISRWCPANLHHCFGTSGANSSTRTTVTTSLTAQSSRRSGHITALNSTARKRMMVSLV